MLVRNIGPDRVRVPELYDATVDVDAVIDIPPGRAEGFLIQVWRWEAAGDDAQAVAAAHPKWWDHPHVAEVVAAGDRIAEKPAEPNPVTGKKGV